jgi:hypothetical protein
MSRFVVLNFECNNCNQIQLENFDKIVYTSWIPNESFICEKCYNATILCKNYEPIILSKYYNLMQNRPYCDKCNKQVISVNWLYCDKCNMDYCLRCNIKNCIKCDNLLIKDKYNFKE